MKTKSLSLILPALVFSLNACQDPYRDKGPGKIVKAITNPDETTPDRGEPYSILGKANTICEETKECTLKLAFLVPDPGKPVVTVRGLPDGMTWDEATGMLTFKPNQDFVDRSSNYSKTEEPFEVEVELRSSLIPKESKTRRFTFRVKDLARPIEVQADSALDAKEGEDFTAEIRVKTADFPKGPFSLHLKSAPTGMVVESKGMEGDEAVFELQYLPLHSFVKYPSSTRSEEIHFEAVTPSGLALPQVSSLRVEDVKLPISFNPPAEITLGLNESFILMAEDPNEETKPLLTLLSSPAFGNVRLLSQQENGGALPGMLPRSVVVAQMTGLTTEHVGKEIPLEFRACGESRNCIDQSVKVKIVAEVHASPIVDRVNWNTSKLVYFRQGSSQQIPLTIRDGEDQRSSVAVEIFPESIRKEVSWSRNQLRVEPKTVGLHQFQVVARSVYGMKTIESFVMEVLPTAWSENVILVASSGGAEARDMKLALKDDADFVIGDIQTDSRTLALRRRIFLTTEFLASSPSPESLTKWVNAAESIVVTSPLVRTLESVFPDTFAKLKLGFEGRLSKVIPQFPEPKNYVLDPNVNMGLEKPKLRAGLYGKATAESNDPMIFSWDASSRCEAPFLLYRAAVADLKVSARCQADGKKWLFLGFDWNDIQLDEGNHEVRNQWARTLFLGTR